MDFVTTFVLILTYLSFGVVFDSIFNHGEECSPTLIIFWPLAVLTFVVILAVTFIYAVIYAFRKRK